MDIQDRTENAAGSENAQYAAVPSKKNQRSSRCVQTVQEWRLAQHCRRRRWGARAGDRKGARRTDERKRRAAARTARAETCVPHSTAVATAVAVMTAHMTHRQSSRRKRRMLRPHHKRALAHAVPWIVNLKSEGGVVVRTVAVAGRVDFARFNTRFNVAVGSPIKTLMCNPSWKHVLQLFGQCVCALGCSELQRPVCLHRL